MGERAENAEKSLVVHWVTGGRREAQTETMRHSSRCFADPTADTAIANVIGEERRKKRKMAQKEARKEARRAKRRELALAGKLPPRGKRRRKHPKTLVWRAEDEVAAAADIGEGVTREGGGSKCGSP